MGYSIKLGPVIVGHIVGQVAYLPVALLVIRPLDEQHYSVGHWWLIPLAKAMVGFHMQWFRHAWTCIE